METDEDMQNFALEIYNACFDNASNSFRLRECGCRVYMAGMKVRVKLLLRLRGALCIL
jgi:hypothetical protein